MIMAAKALLDRNSHPTREEIHAAMSGNLCRCTGYTKIEEAIVAASRVIDQYANGKGAQQWWSSVISTLSTTPRHALSPWIRRWAAASIPTT